MKKYTRTNRPKQVSKKVVEQIEQTLINDFIFFAMMIILKTTFKDKVEATIKAWNDTFDDRLEKSRKAGGLSSAFTNIDKNIIEERKNAVIIQIAGLMKK